MHWVGGSAMYEGECQGFEPSGARLGRGGDDHVVGALPKMHLHGQARRNGNSGFMVVVEVDNVPPCLYEQVGDEFAHVGSSSLPS